MRRPAAAAGPGTVLSIGYYVFGLSLIVALAGAPAARAAPDCRCRHAGAYYQLGETACIRTPDGPRLARCAKVSNLSSWRFTTDSCGPTARRPARGGRAGSRRFSASAPP